jgi:hypothetical protein
LVITYHLAAAQTSIIGGALVLQTESIVRGADWKVLSTARWRIHASFISWRIREKKK